MNKLTSYLAKKKIDQKTFASMINTTQATLSRVINGKFKPTLELAVAIEKVTNGKVRCEDWL